MAEPASRLRQVRAQAGMELRLLTRSGESLLVTLGLPLGALLFFGAVDVLPVGNRDPIDFLVPGVLAISVMATAMVQVAIQTAFERKYGVLKRLGGTPLSRGRYLAAKAAAVAVVLLLQTVLVLVAAVGLLGWEPTGGAVAAGGAMAAGALAFTALGLLLAGTLTAEATLAVVNALFVVLLLISGAMVARAELPGTLARLGAWTPAGALVTALRAAFEDPARLAAGAVTSLVAWGALAAGLGARLFRWEP